MRTQTDKYRLPRMTKLDSDSNHLSIIKNVNLLHPAFRDQLTALLTRLNDEGSPFILYEGYRSAARHNYLYAQGRTRPGNRITYVEADSSLHPYGLAADLALKLDDEPSWSHSTHNYHYWENLAILAPDYSIQLGDEDYHGGHVECTFISILELRRGLLPSPGTEGSEWWDNLALNPPPTNP